jgi:hypothetical protein
MKRLLPVLVLVVALLVPAALAGAGPHPSLRAAGKVKCKRGYVARHRHGKWVCEKKKTHSKPVATPGLDVIAAPGTYTGSNGVTITTATTPEGEHLITIKIAFPSGYVSCQGKPPYPTVTVSVPDMPVSELGNFAGTSAPGGASVSIQGHFTAPNALVLETAGASNVVAKGERCAAQYTDASVVF